MSNVQRQAARWFSRNGVGAVHVRGRWVWAEDVRRDERAARDVVENCR